MAKVAIKSPAMEARASPLATSSSATYGNRPWMKMASKKTDPKHTLARGSAKMLRKFASTTARSNDACCCGTTARSAKKLSDVYDRLGTSIGRRSERREISSWFALAAALLLAGAVGTGRLFEGRLP